MQGKQKFYPESKRTFKEYREHRGFDKVSNINRKAVREEKSLHEFSCNSNELKSFDKVAKLTEKAKNL